MTSTPAAPATVVAGLGARPGTDAATAAAAVTAALADAGVPRSALTALATLDRRAADPALQAAAARLGIPLTPFPADALAAVDTPHRSAAAAAATGTPSVAEAAALLAAGPGAVLVLPRRSHARTVTVALAAPAPEPDLRHHGDAEIRAAAENHNITDLAVNVRTGTPPAWLRERLAASLADLAAYPDGTAARAAVAARHGRPPEDVLLTAGAAEAFVLLARALNPRHAVVVHPQFTEPEAALRDAGHSVDRLLLAPEQGFRLDPARIPETADLVVLGNPTNPTSILHPAADIAALSRPGRTLVVDEAFADTVPGEAESLAGRRDVPGLVVLRSLTKTWGLAGLRIGYLLAGPSVVAELERAQPLWPVSTPALEAAVACSAPAALAEAEAAAAELAEWRAYLLHRLAGLPGVTVHGSPSASFVLVRVAGAAALRRRLRERGFALRRGDTFPGLGPDWLRIAVRGPAVTDALVEAVAAELPG